MVQQIVSIETRLDVLTGGYWERVKCRPLVDMSDNNECASGHEK